MQTQSWLLLLFSLPATHKTERVAVWRKLKKAGAVQIKTSTYLLPDLPELYELFQWLAQQVRDYGGESTLIRAREIEGLTDEKLIGLFNSARETEYAELGSSLRALIQRRTKKRDQDFVDELERVKKQFRTIRDVDFFQAPRGHDVEVLCCARRKRPGREKGGAAETRTEAIPGKRRGSRAHVRRSTASLPPG